MITGDRLLGWFYAESDLIFQASEFPLALAPLLMFPSCHYEVTSIVLPSNPSVANF